jgi:hypothetical protein
MSIGFVTFHDPSVASGLHGFACKMPGTIKG